MTDSPTPGELLRGLPFAELVGIELAEGTPDLVRGTLAWSAERCTAGGMLHGGALLTLADSVGGICAFLNLPAGRSTATIETKTNFIRGVREGSVQAEARPLHVGRSTIVVQTTLRDDRGRLVAQTTQTQAVVG
ncbi:MAG: PaaI family thioesterase [Candidatus Dormiibacterota bacterium]